MRGGGGGGDGEAEEGGDILQPPAAHSHTQGGPLAAFPMEVVNSQIFPFLSLFLFSFFFTSFRGEFLALWDI